MQENIIMIGMPGVGKSTVGVILAKELGMSFVDSDLLIQEKHKCLLKDIIASKGVDGFLEVEAQVNSEINTERAVISTGGSAVYSEKAMEHLKSIGTVVYLKLPYEALEKRLGNLHNRGVVLRDGQTLRHLYEERTVLYEKYADIVIDEENRDIEQTIEAVKEALAE